MLAPDIDTIVALATPAGRGGIGVVRVSGPKAKEIIFALAHLEPKPRYAHLTDFKDESARLIDQGLVLFFPGPHSFTGEDVAEFQLHGGPVVLDRLIQVTLRLGARMAQPGEFSQRAFLNGKIDLTQAEAIADMISASTEQAHDAALRSLQGAFSAAIHELNEKLIDLRMYVEAAIDFPEEEIDFLSGDEVSRRVSAAKLHFNDLMRRVSQGVLLKEGKNVVIIGEPNAGKSSLLNQWTGVESAIVTDIPGTTRDLIQEGVSLDGMPLHLIDTAGIRFTDDIVEKKGIERAHQAIEKADVVIWLIDAQNKEKSEAILACLAKHSKPVLTVYNKIDLTGEKAGVRDEACFLSAKSGLGFEDFLSWLKVKLNVEIQAEGTFLARRRHLDALERTEAHLMQAESHLKNKTGELMAEELRLASLCLQEMTGTFTSDDLLGKIFSSFCIGK